MLIHLQKRYISFTDSFLSLVAFVTSAGDVTSYRMDLSGYYQKSSGLKFHNQIPFKLYPLQGWHLNEFV